MPRAITPVAVPLKDNARLEDLLNPDAMVSFDADGSGLARRWTWITSDAGWLVFNSQHRPITSALQLFGNVTFWLFWENGYQALRSLDDDGDGRLRGRNWTASSSGATRIATVSAPREKFNRSPLGTCANCP